MPWDKNDGFRIDEDEHFVVYSYLERVGTYATPEEVWQVVEGWELGQDRIIDRGKAITKDQLRALIP